jgi:hypothetical protein
MNLRQAVCVRNRESEIDLRASKERILAGQVRPRPSGRDRKSVGGLTAGRDGRIIEVESMRAGLPDNRRRDPGRRVKVVEFVIRR